MHEIVECQHILYYHFSMKWTKLVLRCCMMEQANVACDHKQNNLPEERKT